MTTNLLETSKFRFEFPAEVLEERKQVIDLILSLMTENTLPAIHDACRIHNSWMERYPNDYVMLDLGGSLWMLAGAIEATTSEAAPADEHALSVSR